MRAAYLFHLINLLVSVLMVPVLLGGLSATDYAIWLAFVAFGNATIQVQNAVQSVVIKDIARGYHGNDPARFAAARRRTRHAYLALAALVLGPVMACGIVYFRAIGAAADASWVITAWVVFAFAYALVYLCGPRNALLIGTGRVDVQNNINTLTRLIQLAGVAIALHEGFGILGLVIAFAAATITGSLLSAWAARSIDMPIAAGGADAAPPRASRWGILRYIGFVGAAYGLYSGMYLVVAAHVPRNVAASYGLCLQIAALLTAVATAPFNIWLGALTAAVTCDDRDATVVEVARTFLVTNLVFVAGFAGLMVMGDWLLELIGAAIRLPPRGNLALVGVAFTVEANILVLVNYLMVRDDFGFVGPYVVGAGAGAVLGTLAARWTGDVYAFVAVPALIQTTIALPLLLARTRRTMGGGAGLLLRSAASIVAGLFDRAPPVRR